MRTVPVAVLSAVIGCGLLTGCGGDAERAAAPSALVGFAERAHELPSGWTAGSALVADVDRDGRGEAVVADGRRGIAVVDDGRVRLSPVLRQKAGQPSDRIVPGDFDGDGKLDLAVVRPYGMVGSRGLARISFGDGRGGFGPAVTVPPALNGIGGHDAAVADLDGDGRDELVLAVLQVTRRPLGIAVLGVGAGRRPERTTFPTTLRSVRRIAVADGDEDGNPDLYAGSRLVRGLGGGRFGTPRPVPADEARLRPGRGEPQARSTAPDLGTVTLEETYGTLDIRAAGRTVSTLVGFATALAVGDLTGDRRSDVVLTDTDGIRILRNLGPRPPSRVRTSATAVRFDDGSVDFGVRCLPGAGSCLGGMTIDDQTVDVLLRAGRSKRFRLPAPPGRTVRIAVRTRVSASTRSVPTRAATAAQRKAACHPRDDSLLAAGGRYTALRDDRGEVGVCDARTGSLRPFAQDAVGQTAAIREPYIAGLYDACPGGFEACTIGIRVRRLPAGRTRTSLTFGSSVRRLALGRGGALALTTCPTLDEGPFCDDRPTPVSVWRLDGRGLRRVATGDIDGRSLRAVSGTRFEWRQDGRRHTAGWRGAPGRYAR